VRLYGVCLIVLIATRRCIMGRPPSSDASRLAALKPDLLATGMVWLQAATATVAVTAKTKRT